MARAAFVGRTAESGRIREALHAVERGEPSVLLLVGEAGAGKSTLARWAVREARARDFAVAVGASVDVEGSLPYLPVRSAVRDLVDADPTLVAGLGDRWPAVSTLLPRASSPGGEPPPLGAADPLDLFEGVLGALADAALRRPLLVVLEDLHWADRSTRDLLSYVARSLSRERVLVLATVRDDALAPTHRGAPAWGELLRIPIVDRIELEGLGHDEVAALVTALAGRPADHEVVDALLARSGGNPFLVTELVEAGEAMGSGLPRTVQEIMAERLAALPPNTAEVVRAASVIGVEIPVPLLARVLNRPIVDVEDDLSPALSAGLLITPTNDGEVRFRHVLLQEAAYAQVLPSQRRRLHGAVAFALTSLPAPEAPVALLAHHFDRAGRPAEALEAALGAAHQAAGAYGTVDAVPHYQRVVELWDEVADAERRCGVGLVDLLVEAMDCALQVGDTRAGAGFAERAVEAIDPESDPTRWAEVALGLSEIRWEQGQVDEAEALLDRAATLLSPETHPFAWARVTERRCFHAVLSGHLDEAVDLGEDGLAQARELGDPQLEVDALIRLGMAYSGHRQFTEGVDLLREALDLAHEAGLVKGVLRATINLVAVLVGAGRLATCIAEGERGLGLAAELGGRRHYDAPAHALLGLAHFLHGNWDRAEALLGPTPPAVGEQYRWYLDVGRAELALGQGDWSRVREELGDVRLAPQAHLFWWIRRTAVAAELELADGSPHRAREVVAGALDLAELWPDTSFLRLAAAGLDAMTRLDDAADADEYVDRAERKADQLSGEPAGAPGDTAPWLHVVRARRSQLAGEAPAASWEEAGRGFGEAGYVVHEAWCDVRRAESLGSGSPAAAGLLNHAHEVGRELGAMPLMQAAEQVAAAAGVAIAGIQLEPGHPEPEAPAEEVATAEAEAPAVALVAPTPATEPVLFRFDGHELDLQRFEIRRGDEVVSVEPQVFDVLAYLVRHRDRVVTKEELLDEVWGDRFVSESALTSRVKDARRAVGDDGRAQRVIQTVHGRGYRFVAAVEAGGALPADAVAREGRPTAKPPRTRYTRSDGYSIAYQVVGDGPEDIVFVPGFVSNLDLQWEFPPMADFLHRLSGAGRLILFDKRGTGLSERVPLDRLPTLDQRLDDLKAVMAAAECERATLFGISEGGPMALLFAATHPDRVCRLVIYGSWCRAPFGAVRAAELAEPTRDWWGTGGPYQFLAPSTAGDREARRFFARYERQSATPDAAAAIPIMNDAIDVSPLLHSIAAPTLVVHRRGDEVVPVERGRELAEGIPGAELVELEGADHLAFTGAPPVLDPIMEFLGQPEAPAVTERVLTTVLFVDLVGSTEQLHQVGDAEWRLLLGRFYDAARSELSRHRGREIKTTGDGLLACFDGPAGAVQCALAVARRAEALGLTTRAGVHTAEVEVMGDDVAGIGVHVAARVMDAAERGEVWATRTVRDLVAGSGLSFDERGTHQLKGVGDPWELFAAS